MLPLSILFSDEYRLLSRQQLSRGIAQYFAIPDQVLVDSWQTLHELLPPLQEPNRIMADTAPTEPLQPRPLTAEAANQRFNQYLKQLEQPDPTTLLVNPADLHPRYEAMQRNRIREGICNRLHALALTAQEHHHCLVLCIPGEETLELSLEILAATLARPGLEGWGNLGICLHTSSKRALPTLGWLEHLGRTLHTGIPVRLISGMPDEDEILFAQQAGYACYPVLTDPEHCRISQELCLQFIQSANNSCLHASLLFHRALPASFQAPPAPADLFLPVRSNVTSAPPASR